MSVFIQVAIAFAALGVASRLSKVIKSFFPPFYILVGILLGPAVLGITVHQDVFAFLGDVGLVFLMFYLGYEFSLTQLLEKKNSLLTAGAVDFAINFSLGLILGLLLDVSIFYILVFAGLFYMSSSSIITKSLIQLGAIKNKEGGMVMGIMIFEDLVMIVFLVIVGSIASTGETLTFWLVTKDIGISLLFAGILVYIGRKYHFVIDYIIGHKSHEVSHLGFMALVLAVVALGLQFGVKEALSAFLLGLAVSETKSKESMEAVVKKFRDIFGGIFFFYFGMTFSFGTITISWWIIVTIIVFALLGKLLSGLLLYKMEGCSLQSALFVGISTIPRGEFSLLIAALVVSTYPMFLDIAIVLILATSFLTTLIFWMLNLTCKTYDVCIMSNQLIDNSEGDL